MSISRREFLVGAVCSAAGSCGFLRAAAGDGVARTVDAGPAGNFAADGVYDAFKDQGFFIVRRGGRLFALSSICTHRAFQLKVRPDHSFYCKRHGSTFSPGGHVTEGPAKCDLPTLGTSVSAAGHLLVRVPAA